MVEDAISTSVGYDLLWNRTPYSTMSCTSTHFTKTTDADDSIAVRPDVGISLGAVLYN